MFCCIRWPRNPGGARLCVESIITDFEDSGAITKSQSPDFLKNAHQKLSSAELMPKASAAVLLTDGDAAVWGNIGDCPHLSAAR